MHRLSRNVSLQFFAAGLWLLVVSPGQAEMPRPTEAAYAPLVQRQVDPDRSRPSSSSYAVGNRDWGRAAVQTAFRFNDDDVQPGAVSSPDDETDRETNDGEDKVDEYLQELFLGVAVYSQERGELQLTSGVFRGIDGRSNWQLPVEVEYGITDDFQVGLEIPIDFRREEEPHAAGVGNVSVGAYYNFYSDRDAGRAYGIGLDLGFPAATADVGPRSFLYEPFFVVYQDLEACALNFSAGLDPRSGDEPTEVAGELALAAFRRVGDFVPLIELAVEIEEHETPVRLAPGLFSQPARGGMEIGVSAPIGMNADAVDFGIFSLVTIEYGGDQ